MTSLTVPQSDSADTTIARTSNQVDLPGSSPVRRSLRRIGSLTRAELKMLLRSKVSFFYAVTIAPLMVLMLAQLPAVQQADERLGKGGIATMLTAILVITGLGIAIYYNLTTATVARREALVLKRLRTGEATPMEILVAIASPNVLIFVVQVALVLAALSAVFGAPPFTNPVLVVLAMVLGAILFAIASFLTSAITRTVESSQLTTMPGMFLALGISGLMMPLSTFPENWALAFQLLPVAPVSDLVQMGLNGVTLEGELLTAAGTWRAAVRPTLVLLAWIGAGAWFLGRTMVWEPRR
ncbi:ABC transporter permease [Luteococcus sp. Sow4_B9]|uniref:ABC transporter permease n=1 Tax=Luteococcus sp. Sow4_B9 TaxID=3438792 RepID=UPI003F9CEFAC